jgi:ABC-2 type transport system permease protein
MDEKTHGRAARLFYHYVRFNLRAGMEYRVSFITQVVGMALNNSAFIIFWMILYGRLQSINGYAFGDVMFLWSLASLGYGLAAVFLGNAPFLSRTIYRGELDVYLLQPKPVLANFLLSRTNVSGWGDISFGVILYAITQPAGITNVALWTAFSFLMTMVLVAMRVIYHSLTFFLGNAEEFAETASDLVLSFILYPGSIFQGPVVILLHSLIPAALIAYIPVELFRHFSAPRMLILLAADAAIVLAAWCIFHLGLRAYESGNRMGTRV